MNAIDSQLSVIFLAALEKMSSSLEIKCGDDVGCSRWQYFVSVRANI